MKWQGGRRSSNVEDRRGRKVAGKGIKLGGWGLVAVLGIGWMMGVNPLQMLNMLGEMETASVPTTQSSQPVPQNDKQAQFVSVVLADTEDVWNKIFTKGGSRYKEPGLVLFTGAVSSACGMQTSATGPFYCPGDKKVYIDLAFYRQLAKMAARVTSLGPMWLAMKSATTCRTCLVLPVRSARRREEQARLRQTHCPFVLNCRPIAMQAYGRTMQSRTVTCWKRAMSKKDWPLRQRLVMTRCSSRPAVLSDLSHLHMVHPGSVSHG